MLVLLLGLLFLSYCNCLAKMNPSSVSRRIENTENAYIEDVLDHYSALNINNLTYLAMGNFNTLFHCLRAHTH